MSIPIGGLNAANRGKKDPSLRRAQTEYYLSQVVIQKERIGCTCWGTATVLGWVIPLSPHAGRRGASCPLKTSRFAVGCQMPCVAAVSRRQPVPRRVPRGRTVAGCPGKWSLTEVVLVPTKNDLYHARVPVSPGPEGRKRPFNRLLLLGCIQIIPRI